MLIAVVLALTLVAGPHPAAAVILGLAYLSPPGFLVVAGGWALYHGRLRSLHRRRMPGEEADFLRGLAAEIDAGASIRHALVAAADRAPGLDLGPVVRLAAAGRPAADVARRLQAALPINGRIAAAAYQMVADTGARASDVFAGLAVRAADAGDLVRERRALTAQTRLSAWLVGGLPAAVTIALVLTGRGPGLHGAGGWLTSLGIGLIGTGGLAVWMMVRAP